MTTTAYRNIRALISLFSLLLIIINAPLPVVLVKNYTMVSIESNTLAMGYLSLFNMYKIVIICNITLGMFASCGVNSKIRMYMRVYLFVSFFYLILFMACILYVKHRYLQSLLEKFNMKAGSDIAVRCLIETDLDCNMATKTCHKAIFQATDHLISNDDKNRKTRNKTAQDYNSDEGWNEYTVPETEEGTRKSFKGPLQMAFQRSEESLRKNKNEETNRPRYNERRDRDSEGHRPRYGGPVDNSSFRGGDNYDRRDYNNMPYNSMQYNNMNYNSMNYNNGMDYNSMNYNNRPNYSMQYDNRPPYNHPTQYANRPPYGDSRMRPYDSRRRGGHRSVQRENKRFVKKSKEQLDKELAAYMACGSTTDQ